MCATFVWPACPTGRISVPGRRAVARRGSVVAGRPRYDVRFADGVLETDDPAEIAAVRTALRSARGQIVELRADAPPAAATEASPQALSAALGRLMAEIARNEELDAL